MTSIHILSDLHLEFADYHPEVTDANIVILSGDIFIGTQGLSWARDNFPESDIIYVSGNHEFYHYNYQELLAQFRKEAKDYGIHFLENNEVVLHGIRFLGCTLWTDYLCSDNLSQQESMEILKHRFSDHRLIQFNDEFFTPGHALGLHNNSINWLREKINKIFDGKTIVVTHHGPSKRCIHKKFGGGELAGGFYSDLSDLLNKPDIWIYGHTHSNLDISVDDTRLISNQRGYPTEDIPDFNPELILVV